MFIPISDREPNRYSNQYSVTVFLVIINTVILLYEYWLAYTDDQAFLNFIYIFGRIPQWIWHQQGFGAITGVTSAFLHGGMLHLVSNMLFLWAFGRRVEDACGHWRFICFYLLCNVTAGLATTIIQPDLDYPSIGSSGSISGVMTAYLLLYPWGRINTLLYLPLPFRVRIRAFWLLIYYLLISNLIPALQVLLYDAEFRTGYWAHLGGFLGGITIFFFLRPEALYRYWRQDAV